MSERTQYLTTARNLLASGADAVERLMTSYKVRVYMCTRNDGCICSLYNAVLCACNKIVYHFTQKTALENQNAFSVFYIHSFACVTLQEIVELAGYTYRVGAMLDVFSDVSKCKYRRNGLSNGKIHKMLPKLHYNKDGQLVIRGNTPLL